MQHLQSFFGLVVLLIICWLMSSNRRILHWRAIVVGLFLQLGLAAFILKTPIGLAFFEIANDAVSKLIGFSDAGASVVFGNLAGSDGVFAFKVLPTVIFVSAVSGALFYLGVLQKIVAIAARAMGYLMQISGAESVITVANVFMGQTEAPLMARPYIAKMTRSEVFVMMVGGMATVAGGVLAAYASFGISAGHLIAASVISAPATIVVAKLMQPESEVSQTRGDAVVRVDSEATNLLDAICIATSDGLKLALNIAAMLLAFIALVALVEYFFSLAASAVGVGLSLTDLVGYAFWPFAYLLGTPPEDCVAVGRLLAKKMILNEFVAYLDLAQLIKDGQISERAQLLATYALCGFANFSSVAIQIGGIGSLVPEKRQDLARLGLKAMVGGTIAANMTACIAGILL